MDTIELNRQRKSKLLTISAILAQWAALELVHGASDHGLELNDLGREYLKAGLEAAELVAHGEYAALVEASINGYLGPTVAESYESDEDEDETRCDSPTCPCNNNGLDPAVQGNVVAASYKSLTDANGSEVP